MYLACHTFDVGFQRSKWFLWDMSVNNNDWKDSFLWEETNFIDSNLFFRWRVSSWLLCLQNRIVYELAHHYRAEKEAEISPLERKEGGGCGRCKDAIIFSHRLPPSSHRLLPTSQLIPNGVWCGEENRVQGFRIFEPKRIKSKIKGRCIFIFIVQVPSRMRTVV